jgi:hypothetical protein
MSCTDTRDATCCLLAALSYDLVAKSLGCLPIRSVAVGGAPTALPASPPPPFVPPAAPPPGLWLGPVFNSDFQSGYSSDFLSSNSSTAPWGAQGR